MELEKFNAGLEIFTAQHIKQWIEDSEQELPTTKKGNALLEKREKSRWIRTENLLRIINYARDNGNILDDLEENVGLKRKGFSAAILLSKIIRELEEKK